MTVEQDNLENSISDLKDEIEKKEAQIENHEKDQIEISEQPQDIQEESQEEYSDIEKEALSRGWKPKSEFTGNSDDFQNARAFIEKGDMISTLNSMKRKLEKQEESLKMLTKLNKYQYDELQKEKSDYYLQQKRKAISEGDVDSAEKFEEAYYKNKQDENTINSQHEKSESNEAVQEFLSRNSGWFNSDSIENIEKRDWAIEKESELAKTKPNLSDRERLYLTEKLTKEHFYSINQNERNRMRPNMVNVTQVGKATAKGVKKKGFNDLSYEEKIFVRDMAQRCNMSADEYAKQIFEMKEKE